MNRILRRSLHSSRAVSQKLTSTSQSEMNHFNSLASSWWDINGPQRILHKMNLLRMDFIQDTVRNNLKLNTTKDEEIYVPGYSLDILPVGIKERIVQDQEFKKDQLLSETKFNVLDVGCGGGILSETISRLPFVNKVTGIDLSVDVLEAAKLHMEKDPILAEKLQYKLSAIEDLPKTDKFDIITMFEVLEHVDYPSKVLLEGLKRLENGGWLFLSTINRDLISWFTTIFMGEHILKIVPIGTHTLEKYINQIEIKNWLEKEPERKSNYKVVDTKGCIYIPAYGWKFTNCPDIGNYFMAIRKM
ncbi:unnamed protein product [Candida verbasci]|uniref:Ubiquinone biosynthesis O-methyltransferase, mitochondrial n=1 Tax=Candida verbasci TaxID=1227364 RepID=A0A9W4XNM1_9ASCO|nr:unnamed protein product [Candida verbasci]